MSANYDISKFDLSAYQEGNLAAIDFDIEDTFPLLNLSDITLSVIKPASNAVFIRKSRSEGKIVTTQLQDGYWNLLIDIEPEDTAGNAGSHIYEIDFINLEGKSIATIKGDFIVEKQYNNS